MFGNYFFSFDEFNRQTENINKKLSENNNSPPLEELLIEEGLIDELQSKNEKLINYFNKEKIKQMLDYIIKEPKEDDHNKGHKFPFICSKLFNVEEIKIMKYFLKTNKELIKEKNEEKKEEEKDDKNKNDDSINFDKDEEKNEDINNGNKDDLYFDLYKDDDIVDENKKEEYEDVKDKEINLDDIKIDKKEEDNKDNNKKDDSNIIKENDNEKSLESGNKDDKVKIIDNNKTNNDNNNEENTINNETKENNKSKEDEDIVNQERKKICIFNSPNSIVNNSFTNKRYDSPVKSDSKKEEGENKEEEINDNYPEDRIEILDYFFSFLMDDSELNYVLCGYFSSLMTNLLNINSKIIIKYLFLQRKDILKRLVYHSYRKSIAETLCKILKYENKFKDDEDNIGYDEHEFSIIRLEIIKDIFATIDINMDTEKLFSISFIINDLTEDKKILESIVSNKNVIQSIINKQLKDLNIINKDKILNNEIKENNIKNNFIIISDIIINWLNNIKGKDIQIPMLLYELDDNDDYDEDDLVQQKESESSPPEVHHTILSQALFDVLPNLIQNNFNIIKNKDDENNKNDNLDNVFCMIQSYNDYKLKPLGLHKIKIVEILTNLIPYCKNIPNEYDDLLINSNFFENAINYIFQFQWNNLYQEALYQFFKQLFTYDKEYPYHEKSSEYLFSKMGLLNIIMTNFSKINIKMEGNSQNGFTAFLVSLSYKINSIIGGNYINLNKNNTREGSITFTEVGENIRNNVINMFFKMDTINNKNNLDENNNKKEIKPVNCMKKYCNEEWNNFFRDNIVNKVKIYEEKLCEQKNNSSFGDNIDDDLFIKDENIKDNDDEDLLGINNKRYKSRDEEIFGDNSNEHNDDDLVNIGINYKDDFNKKNKDEDMAKFKDMEININYFKFDNENKNKNIENIKNEDEVEDDKNKENNEIKNIKNENEDNANVEIDNQYNTVNYWKFSLEKENNSYLNNIGEEALNELEN